MIKCKVHSSFDFNVIEQMIMRFYEAYEIVDVKFSTAIDVTFNRVNYSAMIIYREKE